ncbi:MAG: hypothetical protein HKO90_09745 [Flavobacteriaceae bacterium]|nr:hypothetical protein [Bacteroidia bacterium]NNK88554.1 hypothetical protein [Flavobacteriaceae bacterium]
MSEETQKQPLAGEEVDLGPLFTALGRVFKSFFDFLRRTFLSVFHAFIWILLFLKKHILLLVIAIVIGSVLGYVKESFSNPVYRSDTLIRQNYSTGETLNDLVTYLNNMRSSQDTITLSRMLNIQPEEASMLQEIELEQLVNPNGQLVDFVQYKRKLDSISATDLTLDEFLQNKRSFNFTDQIIIIRSIDQIPYGQIVDAIIERVSSSSFFQNQRKKILAELDRREGVINDALTASDSLQKIYREVLVKSVEPETANQTTVTIDNTSDQNLTKEYELFKDDIELRRELVRIARAKEDNDIIIEILGEYNKVGVVESGMSFGDSKVSYPVAFGILAGLLILTLIVLREFLRFIEDYQEKRLNV